jgi:hypothetical protein
VTEGLIQAIFLAHLAATLVLVGLIWFVQLVHYPLLTRVRPADLPDYQQAHMRRTVWVVAPPMLTELVGGVLLLGWRPPGVTLVQAVVGVALLSVIWLSTQLVQVPCHERLARTFDAAALRRLVLTNWLRTVAWSLRGGLVLWMLWNSGT